MANTTDIARIHGAILSNALSGNFAAMRKAMSELEDAVDVDGGSRYDPNFQAGLMRGPKDRSQDMKMSGDGVSVISTESEVASQVQDLVRLYTDFMKGAVADIAALKDTVSYLVMDKAGMSKAPTWSGGSKKSRKAQLRDMAGTLESAMNLLHKADDADAEDVQKAMQAIRSLQQKVNKAAKAEGDADSDDASTDDDEATEAAEKAVRAGTATVAQVLTFLKNGAQREPLRSPPDMNGPALRKAAPTQAELDAYSDQLTPVEAMELAVLKSRLSACGHIPGLTAKSVVESGYNGKPWSSSLLYMCNLV